MFVVVPFLGTVFPGHMMSKEAFINDFEEGYSKGFHMILVYHFEHYQLVRRLAKVLGIMVR